MPWTFSNRGTGGGFGLTSSGNPGGMNFLKPTIITSGLILHLDAGNVASYPGTGTTWTDLSGNNNTGTLVGGPTFNSANDGNIVFDGSNDYVSVANPSTFNFTNTTFTVDVWFKITSFTTVRMIVTKGLDTGGWGLFTTTDSKITVGLKNGSDGRYPLNWESTSTINTNTWYNVISVITTNTSAASLNLVTVHLNGNVADGSDSPTTSGGYGTEASSLQFGRRAGASPLYLNGSIGIVKIYNRLLSAEEITQNFNVTRGRFGV